MSKMSTTWRRHRTSAVWLVCTVVSLLSFSPAFSDGITPSPAPSGSPSSSLPSVPQSNQTYDCKKLGITSTLFVISGINLTLVGTTFINCPAGALFLNSTTVSNSTSTQYTTANLTECVFINNTASLTTSSLSLSSTSTLIASTYGAALIVTGSLFVTLTNCNFTGNTAALAPAIYSSAGSSGVGGLTLSGCSFSGNSGHGTVTVEKGILFAASDCIFQDNYGGSAVYLTRLMVTSADQTVKMTRMTFERNVANASGISYDGDSAVGSTGAAVYISSLPADISINASTFKKNVAATKGGALAVNSGERATTLYDCIIESNEADLYGGAVYLDSAAELVAEGSRFVGNKAKQGGAIAVTMISELTTTNCNFTGNIAGQFGGAISGTTAATIAVYSTTFTGNFAKFAGAIECWSCAGLTAKSNTFTSNYATGSAGALALMDGMSEIRLSDNVFEGNWVPSNKSSISKTCSRDSNGSGGAACVALQTMISLSNNTFRRNSATTGGALFVSRQCDVQVDTESCLKATLSIEDTNKFTNNTAVGGAGGAVYALNVTALTVACTSTTTDSHEYWVGADIPSWQYGSEGCTSTWTGNTATMGGYGNGLATGLAGLRLAGTNGTNSTGSTVSDVKSDTDIVLKMELYDAFGSMMSQGSYEVDSTVVTIDTSSDTRLLDFLSGTSSNTTSSGTAEFNALRVQAPPGSYNLTFLPLPAGTTQTEAKVYNWITMTVKIRKCRLGETTAASGDLCNLCSGTSYYSMAPTNSSCDWCPDHGLCLHAVTTTTSTTANSSSSSSSSSGRRRLSWTNTSSSSSDSDYDYDSLWDYSEDLGSGGSISNKGYLLPEDGYWHSSPFSPQMLECPVTDACTTTNRARRLGRWQEKHLSWKDIALPTRNDSVIWNISTYWNLQCAEGYTGPLCAICAENYGWRSSGSCYSCPSRALNTWFYILSYGLTAVLLVVTIRSTMVRSLGEERAAVRAARKAGSLRRRRSEEEDEEDDEEGVSRAEGKRKKDPWRPNVVESGEVGENAAQGGSMDGSRRSGRGVVAEATAMVAKIERLPFGGSRRGSKDGRSSIGKSIGNWKGPSVGSGSGGCGGRSGARSANLLEQAAMVAMAQLEAEAAAASGGEGDNDDDERSSSDSSSGRSSIRQLYRSSRGGTVVRDSSGAILLPAALPGVPRVGSGRRVPRSVRARESALAAAANANGGDSAGYGNAGGAAAAAGDTSPGDAAAAATGDGRDSGGSRRHRLSRMSRPALTAATVNAAAGSAATDTGGGGRGPVAEGLLMKSASHAREVAGGTMGWMPGMRRRRPGDVDGGPLPADGDESAVQRRADASRGGRGWGRGFGVAEGYIGGSGSIRVTSTESWTQPSSSLRRLKSEGETSEGKGETSGEADGGEDEERSLLEEKPPHAVVIKILVSYLQVTTVVRNLNLEYPDALERLFNIGSMASSAVSTFVSLDCSLPTGALSKAIKRTLITITLPAIFSVLAVPIWLVMYAIHKRAARRAVPDNSATSATDPVVAQPDFNPPGGGGRDGAWPVCAATGGGKGESDEKGGVATAAAVTTQVVPCKSPPSAKYSGLSGRGDGMGAPAMGSVSGKGKDSRRDGADADKETNTMGDGGGGDGDGGGGDSDGGEVAWAGLESTAAATPLSLYLTRRMLVTTIAVVFYFYPAVTDAILSILQCEQADVNTGDYRQYLRAIGYFWELDYRLHCFHGQHLVMATVVAFPGIVLWAVGVPAGSAIWLRRGSKKGLLSDQEFSCRYGFLYEDYRRRHYYWESVIMARKLLVVGLLIATSNESDIVQVLTVLGVVILATAAQVLCRPFDTPRFNNLEVASLTTTTVILYLCAFFLVPDLSSEAKQALSVLILIINIAMLLWFIHCLVRETWRYSVTVLDMDGDGRVSRREVREWLQLKLGAPLGQLVAWMAGKGSNKRKTKRSQSKGQQAGWRWGGKQGKVEEGTKGQDKGTREEVGGEGGGAVMLFVTSPKPATPATVVLLTPGSAPGKEEEEPALSTLFSPPFLPPPPAQPPRAARATSQGAGGLSAPFSVGTGGGNNGAVTGGTGDRGGDGEGRSGDGGSAVSSALRTARDERGPGAESRVVALDVQLAEADGVFAFKESPDLKASARRSGGGGGGEGQDGLRSVAVLGPTS